MTSGEATSRSRRTVTKPTTLALMVLALLSERPMHPYEMQRVMAYRGKEEIINVQRGSLYPAVERLVKAGLVEPAETAREGRRPERTTYRLTEEGQETCQTWLASMLQNPRKEYPEFPAAIAFLPVLSPEHVRRQLMGRVLLLTREIAAMETSQRLFDEQFGMPRLFGLEDEFRLQMVRAELLWVQSIVDDLQKGELHWNAEQLKRWAEDVEARAGHVSGGAPAPAALADGSTE